MFLFTFACILEKIQIKWKLVNWVLFITAPNCQAKILFIYTSFSASHKGILSLSKPINYIFQVVYFSAFVFHLIKWKTKVCLIKEKYKTILRKQEQEIGFCLCNKRALNNGNVQLKNKGKIKDNKQRSFVKEYESYWRNLWPKFSQRIQK